MSKEEKEMTEDLIVAAINDAKQKGRQLSRRNEISNWWNPFASWNETTFLII